MSEKHGSNVVIEVERQRKKPTWCVNLTDFANMVKAFIGSNYLSVAYAVSQSGLALGIAGMVLISGLTGHCCHLLIKTKYHIIKQLLAKQQEETISRRISASVQRQRNAFTDRDNDDNNGETLSPWEQENNDIEEDSESDMEEKENYMKKHMTFGDVGQACFGTAGVRVVNFCIALTQFGFCVGYFIFLGNTIHSLFPVQECYVNTLTNTETCHIQQDKVNLNLTSGSAVRILSRRSFDVNNSFDHILQNYSTVGKPKVTLADIITVSPLEVSTGVAPSNVTDIPSTNGTTTVITPSNFTESIRLVDHAPNLIWLVAAPLPIFLAFALIRSVRYLGLVSVWANFSILFGCVSVFVFLILDFHISTATKMVDLAGFPVFFGMVTGSFEGIGLVIPIESSMEGNRHLFPLFLTLSLLVLTTILGCFGILGYLKYGGGPGGVAQMLNKNIPKGNHLGVAVNIGICIGILLTFPLQIFPVIEIIERALFCPGSICGPRKDQKSVADEQEQLIAGDQDPLQDGNTDLAARVPDSIPAWKRNIVRVLIVLTACGLAILLRNYFAYVGAFIGSVGSSVLGFILPCLFHLKACWKDINVFTKVKDIVIVMFGVCASLVCAGSVVQRIATNSI